MNIFMNFHNFILLTFIVFQKITETNDHMYSYDSMLCF